MSVMAILAVALYAVIIVASLLAARTASTVYKHNGDMLHWVSAAMIFLVYAGSRLVGTEERLGSAARSAGQAIIDWGHRQAFQVPLTIAISLIGLALLTRFFLHWRRIRRGSPARLVLLSRYALFGLFCLLGLRLVSLHQIDMVLYSGPLRINWLLEGTICLVVASCAALYTRTKKQDNQAIPRAHL